MTSSVGWGTSMDLAFVFLMVLIGTGAIVYAGLRPPAATPENPAEEIPAATVVEEGGDGESC